MERARRRARRRGGSGKASTAKGYRPAQQEQPAQVIMSYRRRRDR